MSASSGDGRDDDASGALTPAEGAAGRGDPAEPEPASTPPEAPGAEPAAAAAAATDELAELRRERDELKDSLLRRRADLENFKKRAERERQAAAGEAAAAIFRRLLDALDNLERALAAQGDEDALRQGVELTLHDLKNALEAHGVTVVDPLGQRFDPHLHQALLHEHVPGFEEGTVAEVLRKGYVHRERLLRPALVKVASGDPAGGEPVDGDGGGEVE